MMDVPGALERAAVREHVDEDTLDYIGGLLEDDPRDADARAAVSELMVGSLPEEQAA